MSKINDGDIERESTDDPNRDIGGDGTLDAGASAAPHKDDFESPGEDPNRDIGGDGTLDQA